MSTSVVSAGLLAASVGATVLGGIRWLRVAQREHYLPGATVRFARRWWSLGPNRVLGAAAVFGLVAAAAGVRPAGLVAAAAVACGPFGLTLRGRTAPLAWTRRLRTVAATAGAMVVVPVVAGLALGGFGLAAAVATLLAVAVPLVVDAALAVTRPVEQRLASRFVDRAAARLGAVHPTVVAITGSYGKTGTKGYITHLVAGRLSVVPTPASFNNTAGLARAVNEQLVAGTDVFVAEMGTYGPGEIAEMCRWCPPDIAVITAIGPVHLERMGTEDRIVAAKAEILERAAVVVLNVDDPRLAALADQAEASGRRVWRCSASDPDADVCVLSDDSGLRVLVAAGPAGPAGGPGSAGPGRRPTGGPIGSPATHPFPAIPAAASSPDPTPGSDSDPAAAPVGGDPDPDPDPTAAPVVGAAGDPRPAVTGAVRRPDGRVQLARATEIAGATEIARTGVLDAPPTNVAVAVAVALELGVAPAQLAGRLPALPTPPSRRQVTTGRTGATIIDDTYNANPAGAAAALDLLARLGRDGGRRVVVTPGMVELGSRQAEENTRFARNAARVATDVVIVGRTNARALSAGTAEAGARVVRVATRDQAVAWVSDRAEPGDVVLYENDLPDHFP